MDRASRGGSSHEGRLYRAGQFLPRAAGGPPYEQRRARAAAAGQGRGSGQAQRAAKSNGHRSGGKAADVTARFRELAARWRKDTEAESTIARMVRHTAYLEIIRLGPDVIPILLGELKRRPDFWFAALRELTGEDPVPKEAAGKIKDMAQAWLKWGRDRGHIK